MSFSVIVCHQGYVPNEPLDSGVIPNHWRLLSQSQWVLSSSLHTHITTFQGVFKSQVVFYSFVRPSMLPFDMEKGYDKISHVNIGFNFIS